jgi:hypothetical protein
MKRARVAAALRKATARYFRLLKRSPAARENLNGLAKQDVLGAD